MANRCCSRRCDFSDEECNVAFLCSECGESIDIEEEYYDVDCLKLCEDCFYEYIHNKHRRIAYREDC